MLLLDDMYKEIVSFIPRKHPVRCSMARGAISVAVSGFKRFCFPNSVVSEFQEVLFSEFPWSRDFRGLEFSLADKILISLGRVLSILTAVNAKTPANRFFPYYFPKGIGTMKILYFSDA